VEPLLLPPTQPSAALLALAALNKSFRFVRGHRGENVFIQLARRDIDTLHFTKYMYNVHGTVHLTCTVHRKVASSSDWGSFLTIFNIKNLEEIELSSLLVAFMREPPPPLDGILLLTGMNGILPLLRTVLHNRISFPLTESLSSCKKENLSHRLNASE
jgi:hypothetical protein